MQITHNPTTQRFEVVVDGLTAFLSYELRDDGVRDYNHTIVPPALGGRGLGSALVKFALEDARAAQLRIVPSCSFVAAYVQRHPEYADVLA